MIDKFGDNLLGCRKNSLRSKCHDALRDTIYNALLIDDKGTLLEQRFSSQNNNRPGDVYHSNFLFGRAAYFDLIIRNTVQLKFVANGANSAGSAAAAGELEKDLKYEEAVADSGALFFPLAVETYGCWTSASLDTIKTIASKVVTATSIPFTQAYSNLMQQLSVNLWKFNARMIQSRLMLDADVIAWDLLVLSVSSLL